MLIVTKAGIEAIRGANPLAHVVAERGCEVETRQGGQLVARCPLGEACGPALDLDVRRGLFHCTACDQRGDVVGFVMRVDHVSFVGALAVLAKRAGLDLLEVMRDKPRPRRVSETPLWALTPLPWMR